MSDNDSNTSAPATVLTTEPGTVAIDAQQSDVFEGFDNASAVVNGTHDTMQLPTDGTDGLTGG